MKHFCKHATMQTGRRSFLLGTAACSLAVVAGNKSIMTVLEDIAREKNSALIYQHENQPYEEFFKK